MTATFEPGLAPSVTDDMMRTARIVIVEGLAIRVTKEEIDEASLPGRLAALAPRLTPAARLERFKDLCKAVEHRTAVELGDVTVNEVEAEFAHPDVLAEAAETDVEDAVKALIDPKPSSPGCLPPAAEASTGGDQS